jgi:hypothetical protein
MASTTASGSSNGTYSELCRVKICRAFEDSSSQGGECRQGFHGSTSGDPDLRPREIKARPFEGPGLQNT